MTRSITPITAASNGGDPAEKRPHGMAESEQRGFTCQPGLRRAERDPQPATRSWPTRPWADDQDASKGTERLQSRGHSSSCSGSRIESHPSSYPG